MDLFSIIILLLIVLIAFFHWVQGLFSATISAVVAVIAAVLAFSYHENLADLILRTGQLNEQASAISLVVLFAVIYAVLRVVFDKSVPGNVMFPPWVDKIGAGLMGIVAAIFGTGVLAIAAQTLPFGPALAGYSRFELVDPPRQVRMNVSGFHRQQEPTVNGELTDADLANCKSKRMLLPVDDAVVGLVGQLSGQGALAGSQSLQSIHPAYLDELFLQRLGIQVGGKRTAWNGPAKQQVTVQGIYNAGTPTQMDAEPRSIRGLGEESPSPWPAKPALREDEVLLGVRIQFTSEASDKDKFVRLGPGSIRLVFNNVNYFPIGTLDGGGRLLYANRMDDYLFVRSGDVDFAFRVPKAILTGDANAKGEEIKIVDGTVFVEAKRFAKVYLAGQTVTGEIKPAETAVLRKRDVGRVGIGVASSPILIGKIENAAILFSNIGVPSMADGTVTLKSGPVTLRESRITSMQIDPVDSLKVLERGGPNPVGDLFVGPQQRMIQVQGVPADISMPWRWTDAIGNYELVDKQKHRYKSAGVVVKIQQGKAERMLARYDAQKQAVPSIGKQEGKPVGIWLYFLVPSNAQIAQLEYKKELIRELDAN